MEIDICKDCEVFKPVCITIETLEELQVLLRSLDNTTEPKSYNLYNKVFFFMEGHKSELGIH